MKRGRIKDKQISILRNGVEHVIAHCIGHSLILDKDFNVQNYINECRLVLEDALIPEYLIVEILDEGEEQGRIESTMPIGDDLINGASSISPAYNPRLIASIIKLQNSLKGEI